MGGNDVERERRALRAKSRSRRLRRDLRLWLPAIAFACCYSLSATAIAVAERLWLAPLGRESVGYFLTISSSSTSNASAAPGLMSGGAPRLP